MELVPLKTFTASGVGVAQWSPDENYLLVGEAVYDTKSWKVLCTLPRHSRLFAWHTDNTILGDSLEVEEEEGEVQIYSVPSGNITSTVIINGNPKFVNGHTYVRRVEGQVHIRNFTNNREKVVNLKDIFGFHSRPEYNDLFLSPDGSKLVIPGQEDLNDSSVLPRQRDRKNVQNILVVIDTLSGKVEDKIVINEIPLEIQFSSDKRKLMVASGSSTGYSKRLHSLYLIDLNSKKINHLLLKDELVLYTWNGNDILACVLQGRPPHDDKLYITIHKNDGEEISRTPLNQEIAKEDTLERVRSPGLSIVSNRMVALAYEKRNKVEEEEHTKVHIFGLTGFLRSPSPSRLLTEQAEVRRQTAELKKEEIAEIMAVKEKYEKRRKEIQFNEGFLRRERQKLATKNITRSIRANVATLRGLPYRPPGAFGPNDPGGKKFVVPDGWVETRTKSHKRSRSPSQETRTKSRKRSRSQE